MTQNKDYAYKANYSNQRHCMEGRLFKSKMSKMTKLKFKKIHEGLEDSAFF